MAKRGSIIFNGSFLNSNFDSDISNLMQQNEFLVDEDYKDLLNCDFGDSSGLMPICEENNEEKEKKFTFQKFADLYLIKKRMKKIKLTRRKKMQCLIQ